jgi:hypothetical protein
MLVLAGTLAAMMSPGRSGHRCGASVPRALIERRRQLKLRHVFVHLNKSDAIGLDTVSTTLEAWRVRRVASGAGESGPDGQGAAAGESCPASAPP